MRNSLGSFSRILEKSTSSSVATTSFSTSRNSGTSESTSSSECVVFFIAIRVSSICFFNSFRGVSDNLEIIIIAISLLFFSEFGSMISWLSLSSLFLIVSSLTISFRSFASFALFTFNSLGAVDNAKIVA